METVIEYTLYTQLYNKISIILSYSMSAIWLTSLFPSDRFSLQWNRNGVLVLSCTYNKIRMKICVKRTYLSATADSTGADYYNIITHNHGKIMIEKKRKITNSNIKYSKRAEDNNIFEIHWYFPIGFLSRIPNNNEFS